VFKLPKPPSPRAEAHELADFAELMSWDLGLASKREIVAYLGRIDENDNNFGCEDDDDENSDFLDEVMNEIERRESACGKGYPFNLDLEGTVLRHDSGATSSRSIIYKYLLLCTRLNMRDKRVHAGIDGALLFEELCADVLKNYLGSSRVRVLVFGTAVGGTFQEKINTLCKELKEANGFSNPDFAAPQDKDGKLDVVAWVPFNDRSVGQLIMFSQCKTGTSYDDEVSKLQPGAFIQKWIDGTVAVMPVRSFCVSESCDRRRWNSMCIDAGIVFDRCRLIDFSDAVSSSVLDRVTKWTGAAKKTVSYAAK